MATRIRPLFITALTAAAAITGSLGLPACAGKLEATVRSQAAQDLGCPEGQVSVRNLRSDNYVRDFSVSACGKQAHYQAACSMVGSCTAYRAEDLADKRGVASDALGVGEDDLQPAESGVTTVVGEAPEGAAEAQPAATEASAAQAGAGEPGVVTATATAGAPVATGEARALTLRNTCPRTVSLFVGTRPGDAGGSYMTLGAGSTIGPKLRTGEQLWLLDAKQAGLASVTIDAAMAEVEIAESCSGLAAR